MKYDIQTCSEPNDPNSIYMRNLYHTFFWGPFKDAQAVIDAINHLDEVNPYWDYDPFCIIYGANPLPEDFVFGFQSIEDEMKERIRANRKSKKE
jgi:hypothetical protein